MDRPEDRVEDRYRTFGTIAGLVALVAWFWFALGGGGDGRLYLAVGVLSTVVAAMYRILIEVRRAHREAESTRLRTRSRS